MPLDASSMIIITSSIYEFMDVSTENIEIIHIIASTISFPWKNVAFDFSFSGIPYLFPSLHSLLKVVQSFALHAMHVERKEVEIIVQHVECIAFT